jgi:1-acyl-sn-glycerol-3-phosphate acyltransferase
MRRTSGVWLSPSAEARPSAVDARTGALLGYAPSPSPMSLVQTFLSVVDTGRISVATALEGLVGTVDAGRCDARLAWWSEKVVRDARIALVVHGRDHAETDEPFIVMSNHQSFYDIPVLYRAIPGRLRMVAKKELFRVPVFGRAMIDAGFIRVDRSDRAQAVASLKHATTQLRAGTRIWIAPEGTRSQAGALGPFKSGGFRMALETSTRILPVAIDGTKDVLPAHGVTVHRNKRVTVTITPPIDPAPYGVEGRKQLMSDVRRAIAEPLGQADAEPLVAANEPREHSRNET